MQPGHFAASLIIYLQTFNGDTFTVPVPECSPFPYHVAEEQLNEEVVIHSDSAASDCSGADELLMPTDDDDDDSGEDYDGSGEDCDVITGGKQRSSVVEVVSSFP